MSASSAVTIILLVLALHHTIQAVWLKQQYGSGYAKILDCCKYAAADKVYGPFEWVWVDTCCIDKTSSAELSEAINSMYRWYSRSKVCYAYLSDVSAPREVDSAYGVRSERLGTRFRASVWFTRGWTLQELLAPLDMVFLDADWTNLRDRDDWATEIAKITGIAERYVMHLHPVSGAPVATVLSWAAKRQTSRLEDAAYCLLGLFNINMPLLYGEGENAFHRLQLELVRSSNDESILLWKSLEIDTLLPITRYWRPAGLVATAISNFELEWDEDPKAFSAVPGVTRPPYSITNQGLELTVPQELARKSTFLLPLNCCRYENGVQRAYAVLLVKQDSHWRRCVSNEWDESLPLLEETVYRLLKSSLYVVPFEWVWSREDLARRGSAVIYASVEN